jgi:hypothetical protein
MIKKKRIMMKMMSILPNGAKDPLLAKQKENSSPEDYSWKFAMAKQNSKRLSGNQSRNYLAWSILVLK